MKVSVIMPAYNAAPFVAESVESVLAQRDIEYELLIGDDASSDETRAVLRRYEADSRVRVFANQTRRGGAATRNALLREARGSYVTPCDADDLLMPGTLADQARFLDEYADVGTVYGDTLVVWLDSEQRIIEAPSVIGTDCNRGWDLRDNLVNHGGSMSRRALVLQVGGYDESVGSVDDWSLWLKMAEITRLHYRAGALTYVWRRHRSSLTCVDPHRARDIEKIVREAAERRRGRSS